ncbi:1-deoxy-D-xylulose-5-phosphate reductoisomerase [Peptococcaceae bacterium 1198_IL3148]
MKCIAIIGSTGSIGCQALNVAENNPEAVKVVALAAGSNIELLMQQAHQFKPEIISVAHEKDAVKLRSMLSKDIVREIYFGTEGLIAVATCCLANIVLTAVTGTVGLLPTIRAIEAGKDIALANKETLVAAGGLVMEKVKTHGVNLFPVDSEHSAIWQCLNGEPQKALAKLILTASGGPFRQTPHQQMADITPGMALKHPNWSMGSKITIDSATLMNKGLEVIEARWLFNVDYNDIDVVVHAQSIIHSMVEFVDGSVIAHLGIPDMRIPIQYALSHPDRWPNQLPKLDLIKVSQLTFEEPDMERFPCLKLAFQAGATGGTMPAVMNAANEIAVARFLRKEVGFLDIPVIIRKVMEKHCVIVQPELEDILRADGWARDVAQQLVL